MTAAGERIHIVQRPNHRLVNGSEKRRIVNEVRNPMQMDHATGGQLGHHVAAIDGSVIGEDLIGIGT